MVLPPRTSGMDQPRRSRSSSRSPSEEGERENNVAQQKSNVEAPEGADSPAASPRDEGLRAARPGSEAPVVLGSPEVASSKATRGSRVPSNASVSQEGESSGSDDESSEEDKVRRGIGATVEEVTAGQGTMIVTETDITTVMSAGRVGTERLSSGGGANRPLQLRRTLLQRNRHLAYQRMSWEALKKSINGLINKVNVSNIAMIIQELLQENIVRGRGLLARSTLQAQSASATFTHVYAAVVAIINSKFPQIGELILKRLILNFRKGYRRNDKAHEVLCLEMLTLLLERPTDDSVEVSISFLKECGLKLTEVSPRGINAIFERLRNILHESEIDKRVQYMIEVMFAIRKDGFKDHPIVPEGLDLVEEEDQFTHMLPLEDDYNQEDILNVFKMDPDFLENEEKYKAIKKEILDEGSSGSGEDVDGSDDDEDDGDEEKEGEEGGDDAEKVTIFDQTEVNLVAFRRTIYLAIQSRFSFKAELVFFQLV
ncbi:unnamed protein product [Coregonus sp. 'balchen']|nr:unnamed protein product [Coregonus sp. 'balchen']